MKKLSCKLFVLAITITMTGMAIAQNGGDSATLSQISAYRQWTRVNAEPVKVDIPVTIDPASALT
jgi:hypothetical protein